MKMIPLARYITTLKSAYPINQPGKNPTMATLMTPTPMPSRMAAR